MAKEGKKHYSDSEVTLILQNSVALQKVAADLAVYVNKLSKDTAHFLELFKEATKTISSEKTEEEVRKEEIEDIKSKLGSLIDQNKIIAKGILLLESILKPKAQYSPEYKF